MEVAPIKDGATCSVAPAFRLPLKAATGSAIAQGSVHIDGGVGEAADLSDLVEEPERHSLGSV
jgi:hypothetical protein